MAKNSLTPFYDPKRTYSVTLEGPRTENSLSPFYNPKRTYMDLHSVTLKGLTAENSYLLSTTQNEPIQTYTV